MQPTTKPSNKRKREDSETFVPVKRRKPGFSLQLLIRKAKLNQGPSGLAARSLRSNSGPSYSSFTLRDETPASLKIRRRRRTQLEMLTTVDYFEKHPHGIADQPLGTFCSAGVSILLPDRVCFLQGELKEVPVATASGSTVEPTVSPRPQFPEVPPSPVIPAAPSNTPDQTADLSKPSNPPNPFAQYYDQEKVAVRLSFT